MPAYRPQGARGAAGRRGAALGRRAARRADRGRGRSRAASALYKRWSGGLPARLPRARAGARGGARRAQDRDALERDAPLGAGAVPPARCAGRSRSASRSTGSATPVVLSDSLPMLEHMGVRVLGEQNNRIGTTARRPVCAARLRAAGAGRPTSSSSKRWRACSRTPSPRVFRGDVENDDFNRLVLRAGLAADEIVVLRAYAKYLKQIGFALSQGSIEATLAAHPRIARMLVRCSGCASIPQRTTTQGAARAGATRSSRRSRRSATCPKTACCASCWR